MCARVHGVLLAASWTFAQAPQPAPGLTLTGHVVTGDGRDARPVRRARVTLTGTGAIVALPTVGQTEWMDPEFLQTLRSAATSFPLGEGENRVLTLTRQKRP